jgi:hypothetical protein
MRSVGWTLGAVAASLVVATVATFPLVTRLGDSIPTRVPDCLDARCVDEFLCLWIVGEGGRRLYEHPASLFDANILHPLRHTLAFSESMLSAGALAAPVARLTGNPILAYDLYFFATYVLSAWGAFLLAREITGDPRAALVAAVVFGLAGERWWFRGHLPTISVQWAPFVMYFWLRMMARPSPRTALPLVLAVWAHTLASAYHGLMLPLLLVPWFVPLALAGPWPRRSWWLATGTLAVAVAVGLCGYAPYLVVAQEIPHQPDYLRADWWGWLALALGNPNVLGPRTQLLPSVVAPVALVAAGLVARRRSPLDAPPAAAGPHLAAALVFWLATAAFATDPVVPHVPGPFQLLRALPGFASMRSPGRFMLLASLGRALVVAIAAAIILRRVRGRGWSWAVVAVLLVGTVAESGTLREPLPLTRVPTGDALPAVYRWLAGTPPETAVLELPTSFADDVHYMRHSLYHGRRLANGYTAVRTELFPVGPDFPTRTDMETLRAAGIDYLVVHRDRYAARDLDPEPLLAAVRRLPLVVRELDDAVVVEVPAATDAPEAPPCCELAPARWRVSASAPGAELAADGDLRTHWQPPPSSGDSALRIELDAPSWITGVTLRFGPHVLDFPRRYSVWASLDGASWARIGEEPRVAPPWTSYRRDHRDIELALRFRPVAARWVEIRVPAGATPPRHPLTAPLANWGVHELRVYARPPADPR